MTLKEAYLKAINKTKIIMGTQGHPFTMIGWKNHAGRKQGPILITMDQNVCIEVNEKGKFLDIINCEAQNYFPWIEE